MTSVEGAKTDTIDMKTYGDGDIVDHVIVKCKFCGKVIVAKSQSQAMSKLGAHMIAKQTFGDKDHI